MENIDGTHKDVGLKKEELEKAREATDSAMDSLQNTARKISGESNEKKAAADEQSEVA